jgi:ornithine cyclodeaminase
VVRVLVLAKEDIKKVFTMKDAIDAAKEALAIHSGGKCVVPLRINLDVPRHGGQSLFMPAYIEDLEAIGVKIISIFPSNSKIGKPSAPAQMVLLDSRTGEVVVIINGTFLTQLRTGAVQGAATDILARKDAKVAALIGTGGQAAAQLEAMLCARDLKEVRVAGRDFVKTKGFVRDMQRQLAAYNTEIVPVESAGQAVAEADIITTVTTSKEPTFDGRLVKEGAHVNGIGSYTPDARELDETIIKRADGIYFDTREGVLEEAGDVIIPLKKGVISEKKFNGELGQVILGEISGRESDSDITLFKCVGMATLDLVAAHRVYKKAVEKGIGNRLEI